MSCYYQIFNKEIIDGLIGPGVAHVREAELPEFPRAQHAGAAEGQLLLADGDVHVALEELLGNTVDNIDVQSIFKLCRFSD